MDVDEVPPEVLEEFVFEANEILDRLALELVELEAGASDELLSSLFRGFHTLKGSAGFLGMAALEEIAHAGESTLARLRAGDVEVSSAVISGLLSSVDLMASAISGSGRESSSSGLLEHGIADSDSRVLEEGAPISSSTQAADPETIRVRLALLDDLLAAAGELVVARNRLHDQLPPAHTQPSDALAALDRVVRDVQSSTFRARLQPMSVLFSKLPRLARDTASIVGKRVRVEVQGAETEVDRSIIDVLREPLVHILRNSVDHGIESPEQRLAAGKPATGTITVRAWLADSMAYVSVSDDGAGVDWAAVQEKAFSLGLSESRSALTPAQLVDVLFTPGFSTAREVSHVSGRGVGLDVVRQALASVGGEVTLDSSAGCGSTFVLRAPLSLLVVPSLLVRASGRVFALSQESVEEVVEWGAADCSVVAATNTVTLRGCPISWFSLTDYLGLPGDSSSCAFAVVVGGGSRRAALLVDEVVGMDDATLRPLDPMLRESGLYSGGAIREDGTVVLAIDVSVLLGETLDADSGTPVIPSVSSADESAEYLVVNLNNDRVVAIAAGAVERVEVFPAASVGVHGGAHSVPYGGGVLPLVSESPDCFTEDAVSAVVLRLPSPGALVGLVVREFDSIKPMRVQPDLSGLATRPVVLPDEAPSVPVHVLTPEDVEAMLHA